MFVLTLLFGIMVGFSLGLTGGGGSIFAVPLLVYGLSVEPHEAVGISLGTVGATALIGAIQRLRAGEVEVGVGLLFAIAGMLGAPLGSRIGTHVPESLLLLLFSILMLFVAIRMWLKASKRPQEARIVRARIKTAPESERGLACPRDSSGKLTFTSRCVMMLSFVGLMTGILSGLFGVGGGFVIVPALVLCSGMEIHRAVATSLLVIALVSASGVTAHFTTHQAFPFDIIGLFVLGGGFGMVLGTLLGRRLSGPRLQKIFAMAILAVAVFVITKSVA